MSTSELRAQLDVPFDFRRQPEPVAASMRPARRVPLTLLLVGKCHGAKASWKGLQLLNWATRSRQHMDVLVAIQTHADIPDRPVVRFEPALDRAIDLALGLALLEQPSARVFRLTTQGQALSEALTQSDAFALERELLALLPRKLTQRETDRLLEWRSA